MHSESMTPLVPAQSWLVQFTLYLFLRSPFIHLLMITEYSLRLKNYLSERIHIKPHEWKSEGRVSDTVKN